MGRIYEHGLQLMGWNSIYTEVCVEYVYTGQRVGWLFIIGGSNEHFL